MNTNDNHPIAASGEDNSPQAIYTQVKRFLDRAVRYYRNDVPLLMGNTHIEFNEYAESSGRHYHVIRIKFRSNKKKIIITLNSDFIELVCFSKTYNIIENIGEIYSVAKSLRLSYAECFMEEFENAVFWGVLPRIKLDIKEIYRARGLSVLQDPRYDSSAAPGQTYLREDCLYYAAIESVISTEEYSDVEVIAKVKVVELKNPIEVIIDKDDVGKFNPGNLFIYNHRLDYNVFSLPVAKTHVTFDPKEYQRLWAFHNKLAAEYAKNSSAA